jgi:hypothetical protein
MSLTRTGTGGTGRQVVPDIGPTEDWLCVKARIPREIESDIGGLGNKSKTSVDCNEACPLD